MAIVHPAFCVVGQNSMEPIGRAGVYVFHRLGVGYKTLQKPRVQLKNR
jgi:hypothetical protein